MAVVIRYVNTDNVSGTTDGTTKATGYTKLVDWEALERTDLVSDGDSHIVNCSGTSADTTVVTIDDANWTTGESNDITITGEMSSNCIFNTDFYKLDIASGNGMTLGVNYINLNNIQMTNAGSGENILISGIGSSPAIINIKKCILVGEGTAGTGITCTDSDPTVNIENCLIYGYSTFGGEGIFIGNVTPTININSCTIYNNHDGIEVDNGTINVINSLVFLSGDADFDGSFTSITYCASDDSQAGTGNFQITQTASDYAALVTDAPGGDFSVTNDSSELYNTGSTTLSDDIIGTSRPQSTDDDVGAFELIVGGVVVALRRRLSTF